MGLARNNKYNLGNLRNWTQQSEKYQNANKQLINDHYMYRKNLKLTLHMGVIMI